MLAVEVEVLGYPVSVSVSDVGAQCTLGWIGALGAESGREHFARYKTLGDPAVCGVSGNRQIPGLATGAAGHSLEKILSGMEGKIRIMTINFSRSSFQSVKGAQSSTEKYYYL